MSGADRILVPCKVARGFFEVEVLVIVAGSAAYVSRDSVRVAGDVGEEAVDGLVAAYFIEQSGDEALVELPGEAVVGGARAWVPASDVVQDPRANRVYAGPRRDADADPRP